MSEITHAGGRKNSLRPERLAPGVKRRRGKSRPHWLLGLRKKLLKSGFEITRLKVRYFLSSPAVWLIETKRAKRARIEGSRLESLQQEIESNLRGAGKGFRGLPSRENHTTVVNNANFVPT